MKLREVIKEQNGNAKVKIIDFTSVAEDYVILIDGKSFFASHVNELKVILPKLLKHLGISVSYREGKEEELKKYI